VPSSSALLASVLLKEITHTTSSCCRALFSGKGPQKHECPDSPSLNYSHILSKKALGSRLMLLDTTLQKTLVPREHVGFLVSGGIQKSKSDNVSHPASVVAVVCYKRYCWSTVLCMHRSVRKIHPAWPYNKKLPFDSEMSLFSRCE
jgi:hypothetical protein